LDKQKNKEDHEESIKIKESIDFFIKDNLELKISKLLNNRNTPGKIVWLLPIYLVLCMRITQQWL
jgi:hypothetical protein